ncbi:MAG TPA: hypothetical protein VF181_05350 [Balneolaceae bacterium]
MNTTEFDRDEILTNFLTDYIDGNLERTECEAFEEYLAQNGDERNFARKALMGKRVLSRFADNLNIPATA